MNKKRIVLIIIVVTVVVLTGVLLGMFVPSLMQTILDMHRGL